MSESPQSPPPDGGGRNGNRGSPDTRLVMISAVLGGMLVLVVSAVLNWPTSKSPDPGASSSAGFRGSTETLSDGESGGETTETSPEKLPVFTASAGTCLNWTQPDAGDIHKVPCEQPHLFEVTGKTDVSGTFGPDAPFPSTEQWQQIKARRCTEVARNYLNGDYDPNGRFKVGAFTPSRSGWERGNRALHCGLQQPGPSGRLFRFTGSVRSLDQSDVYKAGTCLGISGTSVSDPVKCSKPHSIEITGVVDLSKKFPDGYPPVPKQDQFLATKCNKLTAKYAGGKTAAEDEGLSVYWGNVTKKSWDAGSYKVNCKVSAELAGGDGLAPVTGSIKEGKVTVGGEPAPTKSVPAAPADGVR